MHHVATMTSSASVRLLARSSLVRRQSVFRSESSSSRSVISGRTNHSLGTLLPTNQSSQQYASHSRVSVATSTAAVAAYVCLLTGVACELNRDGDDSRFKTSMEGQNVEVADANYSYHEPGTVEELQHYLSESFGRPRIVQSTWAGNGVERTIKQTIMDAINSFYGETIDGAGIFDGNQRVFEPTQSINKEFPSLAVHLVDESGKHSEFQLNSSDGIPIENDMFAGRVLIVVRPHDGKCLQDIEKCFDDRERFEFQIQGQFKKKPKGEIYFGAELADNDFRLGTVTKGLSSLLLRLLSQCIGPVTYSFGGKGSQELPHISFPMKQAMENVIVTPAGAKPPVMGQRFVESEESISRRKISTANGGVDEWDFGSIYSMSFASSCVDLPTWQAVYPHNLNLSTFWGDSPLRLVVYEKELAEGETVPAQKHGNKYLFSLQVRSHEC